jgi:hypothetical protein
MRIGSELFDEHDIHSDLRHLSSQSTEELPKEFLAELMAFGFSEDYKHRPELIYMLYQSCLVTVTYQQRKDMLITVLNL